jgi:hypothetical protein
VTALPALKANDFLSSRGMMLFGSGFIVSSSEAKHLGLGRRPGLEKHIRPYLNGRDLTGTSRGVMVIDLFGLQPDAVRKRFPEVYQHILATVKPERDANRDTDIRTRWWLFGRTRDEIRPALEGLPRYIATVETAKHRVFPFLDASILPDNKLLCIALGDGYHLGVLSSRIHVAWDLRSGGWLGVGNDPVYVKSKCFDPFPFPDPPDALKAQIREAAEELDALRKSVQAYNPGLTLTEIYNVLEKLRAGAPLTAQEEIVKDRGLVLILRELHDKIDALVAEAYGWPHDLPDEEVLARLVALNAERAAEEKRGLIRWLRPDYQCARAGVAAEAAPAPAEEQFEAALVVEAGKEQKPSFPAADVERMAAFYAALAHAPQDARAIAATFRQAARVERAIDRILKAWARVGQFRTSDGRTFSLRRSA